MTLKKQLAAGFFITLLASALCSLGAENPLLMLINVWSILGLILLLAGLILFLIRDGYFDFLAYSMSLTRTLFSRQDPIQARKKEYYQYKEEKVRARQGKKNVVLRLSLIILACCAILPLIYELI